MRAYIMKPAASRGISKGRSLRANICAPGGFGAGLRVEFRGPAHESRAPVAMSDRYFIANQIPVRAVVQEDQTSVVV
jgi:hypothetical protein